MGTEDFTKNVFEKVYESDVNRLRSMEDMWKTRKPPTALAFDEISKDAQPLDASISAQDQKVWSLPENFVVFRDRLVASRIKCWAFR